MGKRLIAAALVAACGIALAGTAPAQAEFGIESFDTDTHTPIPDPNNPSLPPSRHLSQAGAHADSTVRFRFRTKQDSHGYTIPDGSIKDVILDLPPGFAGNPQAVPQCSPALFNNLAGPSCPPSTQVGIANTEIPSNTPGAPNDPWISPVYSLTPGEGETAAFGFYVVFVPVKIVASVRPDGDYALRTTVPNISQASTVFGQELTLWGVPADPVHDWQRYSNGSFSATGAPAGISPRPFLTLPPACRGQQISTLRVRAWGREDWVTEQDIADDPDTGDTSGPKGCDKLGFGAGLTMRPGDTRAGAPAPYTAKLDVELDEHPRSLATANVKDVQVTLPEGTAISPSSADGLGGCTPEQLKLGTTEDATCPDSSKIGDVEIATPLLPSPLKGEVYLRAPTRDRLFALAIVARGHGVLIKLPGEIDPDPVTGRVTTTFRNNPQLPFETLTLSFKSGPRAPLTNPQTCGPKTTTTTITSWAGHTETSSDTFTIDRGPDGGPCRDLGFAPSFSAGTTNPAAGASSTFSLTFGRSDGDQDLRDITVQMPPGLTGKLALADQCSDALAGTGACGEGSRIGSVTVASGAGSNPFHLPGRVYMTGPYKGAPLGLAIVVPAIAGPFDLGTVVVRAGVHVDRANAALRVVADPMPSILQGVPLRVRTVNVRMDRAGFMINPTACDQKRIAGRISSTAGSSVAVGTRFRAANCSARPVAPKMALTVGARGRTRAEVTTPLTATLTQTPGQGNLRVVDVNLPRMLNSRIEVVSNRNACAPEQYARDACPQVVGTATAVTPLLRDPLRGSVYFLKNPARRLPDLAVALRGTGSTSLIRIDLRGKVSIPRDLSLRTTFDAVPDVPISKFTLRLVAGRNGAIGTVQNLCTAASRSERAKLSFRGHNGKLVERQQRLTIKGCGSRAAGRRAAARRAGSRRGGSRRAGSRSGRS